MKTIIFDTETTGLTNADEIVELAITDSQGKQIYLQRFKPTEQIHPGASRVTGITNEMLDDEPTFTDEYDKIVEIFESCTKAQAYNAQFDIRMLKQTCEKYNLCTKFMNFVSFECVMLMYSNYEYMSRFGDSDSFLSGSKNHKLGNACAQMGVKVQNAHEALGDCVMTANLVQAMQDDVNGNAKAS